ncbi:lectin like domain-containing protein [Lachnotalea glycerini]|uniref:Cell surface protein n=1 Tax=Lachnotalea glycerini TaxID=1763509 RepID=A0A371JGT5_9FIRM|nr:lectin like domain-containing protein [Lachnotalea glycerini]RDY31945.1 cell surface protein [Lachnotalea glycerini]
MKYSIKYIVFTIILFGLLNLNTNVFNKNASVVKTNDISYVKDIWNPLISDSVNEKKIILVVDGLEVDVDKQDMFMDENLNIMISYKKLKQNFDCAVNLYDNDRLVFEKYNTKIELEINSNTAYINNAEIELDSEPFICDSEIYVPLELVAREFDYDYQWDIAANKISALNNSLDNPIVPYSYDLRDVARNSKVKNQGSFGTCWAFASLTAIESSLLPEEELELAPDHMSLQNSFSSSQNDGGEYTMAAAYLTSWQGPVYEKDDPYGDGVSNPNLTAVKHVQEVQILPEKNYEKIKEAVYKYGGVQSSLYLSLTSPTSKSVYYNRKNYAYCYKGEERPNHDIVIIGWDDNYPKENFNMVLEQNGAFICQNSWGESFGDDGVFYVSYYDVNIGIHNVVYSLIEDTNNYDNIYQSDLCGWVGQLGYGRESVYFANAYTANTKEEVSAAGFYATGENTDYEMYYISNFENIESLGVNNRKLIKKGKFENAGFYTVKFDTPKLVAEGEKFAIMIYINTPNSVHPAAIEYHAEESTKNVDLSDGEGYISNRGKKWDSVEETQSCNLCLKVYTKNVP